MASKRQYLNIKKSIKDNFLDTKKISRNLYKKLRLNLIKKIDKNLYKKLRPTSNKKISKNLYKKLKLTFLKKIGKSLNKKLKLSFIYNDIYFKKNLQY